MIRPRYLVETGRPGARPCQVREPGRPTPGPWCAYRMPAALVRVPWTVARWPRSGRSGGYLVRA